MSGRRPRKVDCADGSAASDVAVVMVSLFGHVDGEERMAGELGVGGNDNSQILIRRPGSGQWTD
jgi:hypothetical protein